MPRIWLSALTILSCAACVPLVDYDFDRLEESSLIDRVLGVDVEGSLSQAAEGSSSKTAEGSLSTAEGFADILALTPEIQALLDTEIDRRWGTRQKLRKLRKLLYGEDQLNIHYDSRNTLTAAETFYARAGNCLSMASLFIATARYVGVKAKYRTVTVDPMWTHDGNTIIRYEHIVATGQLSGGKEYVIDFLPEFVIGDMRSTIISDEHAVALYYNNLGAESMIDGRIADATKYLRFAIKLAPEYSNAWNNMGAAMRRSGEDDLAEFSYLRAIHQDRNNYTALSNLARFYKLHGREIEAAHFIGRVNSYRAQNPYYHYFMAELSFREGNYIDARRSLKKSIRLKRDEPDFYEALARAHEKLGDDTNSLKMLALADKYRKESLSASERQMNHRYWTM